MMPSNILSLFQWWLAIFLIGTAFLPLTFKIFNNFFDKGYIFSKTLGIAIFSYAIFLIGIMHIAPFNTNVSYLVLLLLVFINIFIFTLKDSYVSVIRKKWFIFFIEEIFFLSAFSFWVYIRSFNPAIHGLEKFMDFGFVNSILRSDYFPPKDMWLTPFTINYYYFGHLITAVLTKFSALPSNITFNFMLSTLFALSLVQSFSLGANLYTFMQRSKKISDFKRILTGILSALLVALSGNLHILYAFFKPYESENPVPLWELSLSIVNFPNSYWYPNATRFIYNTIHEFPSYSWVVADLHGHVLDIPFVLLTIAALLALFMKSKILSSFSIRTPDLLLISFLLAVMYMTNAWDGVIYFLLTILVIAAITGKELSNFFKAGVITLLGLIIFSLPYNYFFKPFASGIGILCSPDFLINIGRVGPLLFEADHCQHSPWWQLLMLYGFFYFFIISFLFFVTKVKKLLKTDIFIFLLIILSTILIIIPEFIYLKDIYPAHFRANTMFKLVFQSFIMLSLTSAYIITRTISSINRKDLNKKKKILVIGYLLIAISLVSLVMTYPFLSIKSYYGIAEKTVDGELKKPETLDGINYLKELYPDDYEVIIWINQNIKGQPVILEAQGDSYTDFARVSSNTGLPTVLGWTVHEWLWRGSYDLPGSRVDEVKMIYETPNINKTKEILQKYNIEYIFIGTLEYEKYPDLNEEKFQEIGDVIYRSGDTKIYKINFL